MKVAVHRRRRHPRADPRARAGRDRAPHAAAAMASWSTSIAGTSTGGIIACALRPAATPLSARARSRASTSRRGRRSSTARCSRSITSVGGLPRRALRRPTACVDVAAPLPRRRPAGRRHAAVLLTAYDLETRAAPLLARATTTTCQHGRRRARHLGGAELLRAGRGVGDAHAGRRRRVRDQPGDVRVRGRRRRRRSCCSRSARGAHTRALPYDEVQGLGPARVGPAGRSTSSSTAPPTRSTSSSGR